MPLSYFVNNFIEHGITKAGKVIPVDHAYIHDGRGYCAHVYKDSLSASTTEVYRFSAPSDNYAHIKSIQISSQGAPVSAKLLKEASFTNTGTVIANSIQNLNHNSTASAGSVLYDSTVAYTGGIEWFRAISNGSSTGPIESGGLFIQNESLEYVTKNNNEDYVLEVENLSGAETATNINLNMFFYEEANGLCSD